MPLGDGPGSKEPDRTSICCLGVFHPHRRLSWDSLPASKQLEGSLRNLRSLAQPHGRGLAGYALLQPHLFQRTSCRFYIKPPSRGKPPSRPAGSRTRSCADPLQADKPPSSAPRPELPDCDCPCPSPAGTP